ncbi:MAG TPA: sigma-70 family RNA polymerase sigma factor [Vicinamibacterales bacterium]|jgi:RNA polymerase sigma-70 factor (ECF subfamily)
MSQAPATPPSRPTLTGANSNELLDRARRGEARALEVLFARYLPRLHAWARRRVPTWARDAVDTEDLVQETVLQTLRRLPAFEPQRDGALIGYLRRSLVNRIRDQFRQAGRRPRHAELEEEPSNSGKSPLALAIDREQQDLYRRAVMRLRPADRQSIVARLELGYSYEQLALVLDKPTAEAARLAVRRALERLAREMEDG